MVRSLPERDREEYAPGKRNSLHKSAMDEGSTKTARSCYADLVRVKKVGEM